MRCSMQPDGAYVSCRSGWNSWCEPALLRRDRRRRRHGNALSHEQLTQSVRPVGDDAVDAQIDRALQIGRIVDRPYDGREAQRLRLGERRGVDVAEIRRPYPPASRLYQARRAVAVLGGIEAG